MGRVISLPQPGRRIVIDTGALIAWAHGDFYVRSVVLQAERLALSIVVPTAVIAQAIRGGPADAPINRFLKLASELAPVTPLLARQAGILLGRTGTTDVVDALVVAEALRETPVVILTSDPRDIRLLVQSAPEHPHVQVIAI